MCSAAEVLVSRIRAPDVLAFVLLAVQAGAVYPAALPNVTAALARPGCTQEDLAAVEILLTAAPWDAQRPLPMPAIRVEIAGLRSGVPVTLALSPLRREPGQRTFVRAALLEARQRAVWLTGSLSYEQDTRTLAISGRYDFCQQDGDCVQGSFVAPWIPRTAVCG